MKVLVACEFSGRVRDSFIRLGHDALSCDWAYPTEIPGPHYQGDVRDILDQGWDLMVAHPDCTYLANSGVQWLTRTPTNPKPGVKYGKERWLEFEEAVEFFQILQNVDIPKIAIENPIPHHYATDRIGKYSQLIQPYQYGEPESKATCFWLKNLPLLVPTEIVPKDQRKQSVFHMAPKADRAHERGRTFWGVAKAIAEQWGGPNE